MIAGGLAGCIAKTFTAPFSRITILYQVANLSHSTSNEFKMKNTDPLHVTIARIVRQEGFLSLWRGNLVTVIHRFPYSAVNFASYEFVKNLLCDPNYNKFDLDHHGKIRESPIARFICGAFSGVVATLSCYPLDLIRTRVTVTSKKSGDPNGFSNLLSRIVQQDGILGLYRGLSLSLIVNVPTLAISFSAYGTIRDLLLKRKMPYLTDKDVLSIYGSLFCGSLSGITSSLLLYPADVIRRRLQVSGGGVSSSSAQSHLRYIYFHLFISELCIFPGMFCSRRVSEECIGESFRSY